MSTKFLKFANWRIIRPNMWRVCPDGDLSMRIPSGVKEIPEPLVACGSA